MPVGKDLRVADRGGGELGDEVREEMDVRGSLGAQARVAWPVVVVTLLLGAFVLALVVAVKHAEDVPFGDLSRDVTVVLDGHPYDGMLSQIGLLFWAATVALALFSACVRRLRSGNDRVVLFLFAAAAISGVLALDDTFLIHENVGQKLTFSVYLLVVAVWLVAFRRVVLRTPYLLLGVALAFFFGSAAFDVLRDHLGGPFHSYVLEDSTKLFGILAWCAYYARLGAASVLGDPDDLLSTATAEAPIDLREPAER